MRGIIIAEGVIFTAAMKTQCFVNILNAALALFSPL